MGALGFRVTRRPEISGADLPEQWTAELPADPALGVGGSNVIDQQMSSEFGTYKTVKARL